MKGLEGPGGEEFIHTDIETDGAHEAEALPAELQSQKEELDVLGPLNGLNKFQLKGLLHATEIFLEGATDQTAITQFESRKQEIEQKLSE